MSRTRRFALRNYLDAGVRSASSNLHEKESDREMRDAWIGRERDARNEGEETQVWEKNKEGKGKGKEKERKERKKEKKERRKGKKRREGGLMAGHGRW